VDRGREVLDVRHPDQLGLLSGLDPHGVRPKCPLDPPRHDLVLGSVLLTAQELLAQVVVDRGIGAATHRARQGSRCGHCAAPAHQ
jgi:hypothetical protein